MDIENQNPRTLLDEFLLGTPPEVAGILAVLLFTTSCRLSLRGRLALWSGLSLRGRLALGRSLLCSWLALRGRLLFGSRLTLWSGLSLRGRLALGRSLLCSWLALCSDFALWSGFAFFCWHSMYLLSSDDQ